MSGGNGADASVARTPSSALHVIVLGSGGGPQESNTTAFLVRSTAEGWRRGSVVALDAGVHLSSITRILEDTLPSGLGESGSSGASEAADSPDSSALSLPHTLTSGPFAGLQVPNATAFANASHIQSALINTYLITHPHLDHISGFVVNTAGLPGTRPKRLAGLPSTILAFKQHIFNNVIWPNLSDENNGAGLVTYMRLVDGGSPALGDGDGRGYVEISDGLAVKVWGVSHGHCIERHTHRGSGVGSRYGSCDANTGNGNGSYSPHSPQPFQRQDSLAVPMAGGGPALSLSRRSSQAMLLSAPQPQSESACVYDSSAYFIRDVTTGREVLMFGDVEPDSISLSPRNIHVWQEAAPKIAAGYLAAIFIECSYDDSQPLDRLYGHLTPLHVIEELTILAAEVETARTALQQKAEQLRQQAQYQRERKRKRRAGDDDHLTVLTRSQTGHRTRRKTSASSTHKAAAAAATAAVKTAAAAARAEDPVSPKTVPLAQTSVGALTDPAISTPAIRETAASTPHTSMPTAESALNDPEFLLSVTEDGKADEQKKPPLQGLKIIIIHVKEKLDDGPPAGDVILEQILEHDEENPLGCEFIISYAGQSLYF